MANGKRLPFEHPPLMPDETLQGFVARIAGHYETGFAEYCRLVGIRVRDLLAGRQRAVRRIADMTGIDPLDLARQAFTPLERKLVAYRGQVLDRSTLRRWHLHGCPACLHEDIAGSSFAPDAATWIRGTWLVMAMRTCPVHHLGYVPFSSLQGHRRDSLFDGVARLRPAVDDLERLVEVAPMRRPSGLEAYVADRLAGRASTASLVDDMPLFAAIRTCEAVGAVALFGPKVRFRGMNADCRRAAGGAGFDVLSAGPEGLTSMLTALHRQHRHGGSRNGKARNVLGALYDWLNKQATGPEYASVRHIVREHILDTMPVEVGRVLLGTAVDRQRVHSAFTACHDGRRLSKKLSRELTNVGLLPHGLQGDRQVRVDHPIEDLDAMRSKLVAGLSRKQASAHLCITVAQFERLIDADLVRPILAKGLPLRTRPRFAAGGLDDFAREIDRVAPILPSASVGFLALSEVAYAATVGMVTVLGHLLAGRLPGACRLPAATGYASVLVDPELFRCVDRAAQESPCFSEAARRLQVSVMVPSMLVKAGHLRLVPAADAGTCKRRRFVSAESIQAFTSEMASLVELSTTYGVHRTTLMRLFERSGVKPSLQSGEVGAHFYKRSEVDAASPVDGWCSVRNSGV